MTPVPPPKVDIGGCTAMTLAKPRAWRLTHAQVRNTLRDNLGFMPPSISKFPAEGRIDASNSRNGFANRADGLAISPLLADAYFTASEELADDVVARPMNYGIACPIANVGTGTCLKGFLTTFGLKMWRRPLTTPELDAFTALYTTSAGQGDGPQGGVKNVAQAFFLSPNFLYRSEVGNTQAAGTVTALTDYELASSLSYTLWDTAPDQALLDLAAQGKLRDKAVLMEQAKRLLAAVPKIAPAMQSFVQQWLHIEDLLEAEKDLMTYSLGTPQVAADLMEENRMFLSSVLFDAGGDKSFKTLFTANYGFVNMRTAPIYGLAGVTGTALARKDFNKDERRGLLTQAAFMWGHSNPDGTHPVERGRYFREEILCEGVPDPPPTVLVDPKFGDASLPARDRLAIHKKEVVCAGCHTLIDDLGLAMEQYDGVGKLRKDPTTGEPMDDRGNKIKVSGTVPLPSDSSVLAFNNFVDLVDKLAAKPDVFSCFASQYMDYATGRRPGENATCEQKLIADDFVKSGYKMDALVLSVINSPSFMARRN
jgi:hypothetical protein